MERELETNFVGYVVCRNTSNRRSFGQVQHNELPAAVQWQLRLYPHRRLEQRDSHHARRRAAVAPVRRESEVCLFQTLSAGILQGTVLNRNGSRLTFPQMTFQSADSQ